MQTDDILRYDVLVQEALRGVLRRILGEVAKTGLPGQHHFYISFDTRHPGVRMSSRLLTRYPEEMTIVLQHQFWDLQVTEHTFEVGLSFNGIPERLLIPFTAIKGFFDPSTNFGLQFEIVGAETPAVAEVEPVAPVGVPPAPRKGGAAPKADAEAKADAPKAEKQPKPAPKAEAKPDEAAKPPADEKTPATVVSLDAFRKKP